MAKLVLVRHGKSDWNDKGLWTGWTDVELHPDGIEDAKKMASLISDIELHSSHTSKLKRAQKTLSIIQEELNLELPTREDEALNERHYGIYTGKNKWQVRDEVGEETFKKIRRSWDHPIPEGETMQQVYNRVLVYYENVLLPELVENKNVIVAASGNSLRALIKHLEDLDLEGLANLEVGIGEVHIYEMDKDGKIIAKEIRGENKDKGKI
jgi:2,3-bisphosphoglycerate-dependent phosphoglycerate mutase